MKKLLAITLTLCMIFSVLVVPVSAAGGYINKDVTADAVAYFYGGATNQLITITENAGYEASKAIDGSADSIFYGAEFNATKTNHNSYHMLLVDLGGPVDITSLTLTKATSDQYTAAREALGASFTKTMNESGCVFATNTIPEFAEFSGANYTGDGVVLQTNLNDGTISDSSDEMYQYVGVWVPYSSGVAVAELKVMADVWANHLQTVEKQITPVSAIYANNDLANETTNKATNVIDNDETTFALADKNSGTYFSIDLGAEYDLTQVEVVFPDDTSIANFIAANSFSTDAASAFNSACTIWASNTESGKEGRINADGQGMASDTSKAWTGSSAAYAGLYGETKYRYITFYSGGASYPIAISEVRVYGMVTEEVVYEADITPVKVQYGVENLNLALDATISAEYGNGGSNYATYDHSYLIDNDPSTVALIGGRAVYSSSTAATPAIVILDLGEPRYLTNIKLDPIAESEESSFVTGLNVGNISNAANVNDGVHVFVSNTLPTYNEPGEQISTSQVASAENSDYTLDGTVAYRYVAIKSLAGSYPGAFSGITIKDTTPNPEKLRFFFTAEHNIAELSAFGAYIVPFALLTQGEDANESADAVMVENTTDAALLTSGSTFAVDITGIEAAYYDTAIVALPFVAFDDNYYYGTAETVTVNEVLAAQAQ